MIKEVIESARPFQWTKNLLIFVALIFSKNFFNLPLFLKTLLAFFLFSFITSSIYIINDLFDRKEDRLHPKKRLRPIARGAISPVIAIIAAFIFCFSGLFFSFFLGINFFLLLIVYIMIQLAYIIFIKHIIILDILAIASGFFIRVLAGAFAINVPVSSWLILCTIMLSLFISIGKRRHEMILLKEEAKNHRPILQEYNISLLDQMIAVVTPGVIITYMLYTTSSETISKFGTKNLVFTIPFVLYGIFRYLYLIYSKEEGGSPEMIIFTDKPMLFNLLFYTITIGVILY